MVKQIRKAIRFDETASRPKRAIALIYDLAGFSQFFNQPDVQEYVPKFLNHISDAISVVIFGGKTYWYPKPSSLEAIIAPIHEKFLGDGALYLWTAPQGAADFPSNFPIFLCNRLWNLQKYFSEVIKKCADVVPVVELPKRIRFGLAAGTVFELTRGNSREKEYIGFCINLASRLQKYCPELAFIASARVGVPESILEKYRYIKVVATKIKGFPKEIVIVDRHELATLSEETRNELFESL